MNHKRKKLMKLIKIYSYKDISKTKRQTADWEKLFGANVLQIRKACIQMDKELKRNNKTTERKSKKIEWKLCNDDI